MNNKKALTNLLVAVNKMIVKLNDEDFQILETGKFEITLNKKHTKRRSKSISTLEQATIDAINNKLDKATTREEGLEVIESYLKNKSQLELFAKNIDVAVMKSDKIEFIKNNIVDATVGARLRSGAIQGKKI